MNWALLALLTAGSAQGVILSSSAISDPHALQGTTLPFSSAYRPLNVFPEKLTFGISWEFVNVGQATISAAEIVSFAGRPAYHIVSTARSNAFSDTFYKVRDINESWFDTLTLSSLGYSKNLREGHFFRDEWAVYDPEKKTFLAKTINRDGTFSFKDGAIPPHIQDVLSSLYYLRSKPLIPGQSIILDVNTKQNWPLVIRVLKRDTITTPLGTFHTVVVQPQLRKREGLFVHKGKDLKVWLTDDSKKIPVMMQVDLFFGHVSASLIKIE